MAKQVAEVQSTVKEMTLQLAHRSRSLSRSRNCSSSKHHEPEHAKLWYQHQFLREGKEVCAAMFGKRASQALNATNLPGGRSSRIMYIQDRISRLTFMVDTGADECSIPPSPDERCHINPNFSSRDVNRSSIPTFGNKSMRLDLGLRCQLTHIFVIADVPCPIL